MSTHSSSSSAALVRIITFHKFEFNARNPELNGHKVGNVDEAAPFWSELEIWEVLEGESEAVNLINHLHLLLLLLQNYIIIIEYIYIFASGTLLNR